jgi:hypothetical protein
LLELAGTPSHIIAGRIVQLMLELHIDDFSKNYSTNAKLLYSKFDPKILGAIVKRMEIDRNQAVMRKTKLGGQGNPGNAHDTEDSERMGGKDQNNSY